MSTITDLVQTLVSVRVHKTLKEQTIKISNEGVLNQDDSEKIRNAIFDAIYATFSRSKFTLEKKSLLWIAEQMSQGIMINDRQVESTFKEPIKLKSISTKDIETLRSLFKDSSMFESLNEELKIRKMD